MPWLSFKGAMERNIVKQYNLDTRGGEAGELRVQIESVLKGTQVPCKGGSSVKLDDIVETWVEKAEESQNRVIAVEAFEDDREISSWGSQRLAHALEKGLGPLQGINKEQQSVLEQTIQVGRSVLCEEKARAMDKHQTAVREDASNLENTWDVKKRGQAHGDGSFGEQDCPIEDGKQKGTAPVMPKQLAQNIMRTMHEYRATGRAYIVASQDGLNRVEKKCRKAMQQAYAQCVEQPRKRARTGDDEQPGSQSQEERDNKNPRTDQYKPR